MCSGKRSSRPDAGFTIIEILIAVAILATIAALVSLSFSTTLRLRETALEDGGREHAVRNCLRLMAEELAVSRQHPAGRWFGHNADQEGRPADLLVFSSAGHVRIRPNAPEADVARLLYTREGDRLVRYAVRNPYAFTTDAIDRTELAAGVVSFNLRYYDRRAGTWLDEWLEGPSGTLPLGVMIEITLLNGRQQSRTYTAWVATAPLATPKPPEPGAKL